MLDKLFANAWKFTRYQTAPVIKFGQLYTGGKSVYYIRDNGAGFDMSYEHKPFGVFQHLLSDFFTLSADDALAIAVTQAA